jgi:hypothetical protein
MAAVLSVNQSDYATHSAVEAVASCSTVHVVETRFLPLARQLQAFPSGRRKAVDREGQSSGDLPFILDRQQSSIRA